MKTISINAIIEGIRAKKDRSLGLTISTPELSTQEKSLFFELQGINVKLNITPIDEPNAEEEVIETDLDQKPQSVRMRNVLFILFKQNNEGMDFNEYYRNKTEKLIEHLKSKIEESF